MNLGLEGKIALVAAASHGLGKASAFALATEGANLAICARNLDTLQKTAEEISTKTGATILPIQADVSNSSEIDRLVQTAVSKFGTIHILINNAGGPPVASFPDLSEPDWEKGLQLNLMSAARLMRAVLPFMQKQKWGRIITINSISGKQPIPELILSSTIRPGLIGLSKTLAHRYAAEGILINTICPGFVMTERQQEHIATRAAKENLTAEEYLARHSKEIPIGRYGKPEEIGDLVAFLSSERASYISGATISIDGGMTKGLF